MEQVAPQAAPERDIGNAQYFFELGFFAAWCKAAQANGTADEPHRPLFKLSDDLFQREWDATPVWVADPEEMGRRVLQDSAQVAEIARLRYELAQLEAALTPSGETKYLHIGEYKFTEGLPDWRDEDGELHPPAHATVPWTTVKEIMARIKSTAGGFAPTVAVRA